MPKAFRLNLMRLTQQKDKAAELAQSLAKDVSQMKAWGLIKGSALNTFAYGVMMAALGSKAPPELLQNLKSWVDRFSDPYVTASLKLLERDPEVSAEEKTKANELKRKLREALPKLVSENGLELLQGGKDFTHSGYPSSPAYNYPLYGLALLPLLEEGDSCYQSKFKNEFGILQMTQ